MMVSSSIFWVFAMTQPEIESWSLGLLASTLPTRQIGFGIKQPAKVDAP